MAIDENHPAVRRLVDKIAAEKESRAVADALAHLLDGVGELPAYGSLAIPSEDDAVEYARFQGWFDGMKQGHEALLRLVRYRIEEAAAKDRKDDRLQA